MANLLRATVAITGTRPLLWHRFGPDSLPLEKQERTGVAGNDPEEWKKTYLATPEGQLYLLPSYVFGAVREGAKFTKKGRGSIQSAVAATLQVADDFVLTDRYMPDDMTDDPMQPVYLDIRSVRNPTTRARNIRYRVAASAGWKTSFTLEWDRTIVSRAELEACVRDAGQLVGLGDGRSIGMGRFAIDSFSVQTDDDKEQS
jgi:hypothetical protein